MSQSSQKAIHMLVDYFTQQKELYGDGFVMSREAFKSFRNAIITASSPPDKDKFMKQMNGRGNGFQAADLSDFEQSINSCMKCSLGKTRTNFVFGVGSPNADLMLIGEAPGAEEDRQGEPFVGRAGQLLNKILNSIQFEREDIFIANILKCRPPGNRDPRPEEVEQCEPYLQHQINLIRPKVILALGRISGQTLLKTQNSLTSLRGKLHDYHGIPMVVTYHPAALLRNPQWKYPTWDDVRFLRKVFDAIKAGDDPKSVDFEQSNKS